MHMPASNACARELSAVFQCVTANKGLNRHADCVCPISAQERTTSTVSQSVYGSPHDLCYAADCSRSSTCLSRSIFPTLCFLASSKLLEDLGCMCLCQLLTRRLNRRPLTRLSVARERRMRVMSKLNLSSSCSSTTVVGETSRPYFLRILSSSNSTGSLFNTSVAICTHHVTSTTIVCVNTWRKWR